MNIQKEQTLPELYWYWPDERKEETLPGILPLLIFTPNSSYQALRGICIGIYSPSSIPKSYSLIPDETYECPPEDNPKTAIIEQIRTYQYLAPGWDGYDGTVPSVDAIEDAIKMINAFPENIPFPKPMVSGDGDVGLFWKHENTYIDLEFSGNGLVTYYARANNGKEYFGDDVEFSYNEIPSDIVETLRVLI